MRGIISSNQPSIPRATAGGTQWFRVSQGAARSGFSSLAETVVTRKAVPAKAANVVGQNILKTFATAMQTRVSGMMKSPKAFVVGASILAGGMLAAGTLYQAVKPFVLAVGYGHVGLSLGGDRPGKTGSVLQDQMRRQKFEKFLMQRYLTRGDGKIHWRDMPDIVDFVAMNTQNDNDFRRDLWYLFGWRTGEKRSPIAKFLDNTNAGLPQRLMNRGIWGDLLYKQEQMHHYLGGAIGNFSYLPFHLINNPVSALWYEFADEYLDRGRYNLGDVHLFKVSRQHRDDFLKHGRFTVAENIRKMLAGQ